MAGSYRFAVVFRMVFQVIEFSVFVAFQMPPAVFLIDYDGLSNLCYLNAGSVRVL